MNCIKFFSKIVRCRNSIKIDGFAGGMKVLKRSMAGTPGSGAGQGGGAGGAVKEGGRGLGMWGTAKEEGYFYNKQRQQLKNIKRQLEDEKKNEQAAQKKQE